MQKSKDRKETNTDKKKKGRNRSIREFFRGKSGRNFLLFLEFLLPVAFFATPDLYYDPFAPIFWDRFYADSLTICGVLWGLLVILTVLKVRPSPKLNKRLTVIAAITTPPVCFLAMELYSHMQFWSPFYKLPPLYMALDFLIYVFIYLILLLLCNSVRGASIAMVLFTAVFSIMNYELTVFRSMSFIASDIYSLMTAVSVANTYSFVVDVETAEMIILAMFLVALLLKLERIPFLSWKKRLVYLVFCVGMTTAFVHVYVFSDYLESIGVDFRVYRPQFKYRFYGTLLTTVRTFGYLHVEEPEGYSAEEAERIIGETLAEENFSSTEKYSGKKPNIICIMNESFADLQQVGDLQVTEDYMPFFRSLKKNTIKGYTYSSVFGGNTANSEFEFLTGNTMGFLPDNSVPYQLFLRDQVPGLVRNLLAQGYGHPLALHPYYNSGYSRYKVYPLMGFSHFYSSDSFSVFTDTVNYHITDAADYRKIIDLYKANKASGEPFFMFNVTMQNHGSYDGSTYETGDAVEIQGPLAGYMATEQFLNMIKMSDDALKDLIAYFKEEKEPTVIIFFGDHQPDLDETFYDALLGRPVDQVEGEELEKLYKVPFLIWANYDIEEKTVERTSNNYLSTYLAEVTGMETTGYMKYLTKLRQEIPAINALGYWGADGKYYELEDESSPYYEKIREYRILQYNNMFGKDEQIRSFFYIK